MKRKNKNLLNLKISNFKKLKFKNFYYNHKEIMNIIEYKDIQKILS